MAGIRNKLTAIGVRQAPAGKFGDGAGLWLVKSNRESGNWILRVSVLGRLVHMGLGSINDVSLSEAREAAAKWRAIARDGRNPVREREKHRRDQMQSLHLLKDVALDCFEARKADLKGEGSAGRWLSPLTHHVLPKLGRYPVIEIDQIAIRDTLKPIWRSKAATAEKAFQRLNIVMIHAGALGLNVDLQACIKARALLGAQGREIVHIPAMAWRDVPDFYAGLSSGTSTHLALRLLILTGVRSSPLRFLRTDHIDGEVWVVPAELMKARKGKGADFRIPLSSAALDVIDLASKQARDGFLFPSDRKGVLSDMTMSRLMERQGLEARPHGFRSSLRDWLAEETSAPREVAETILAHVSGGKVELAYRRTDYFDQRKELMQRWADWVTCRMP